MALLPPDQLLHLGPDPSAGVGWNHFDLGQGLATHINYSQAKLPLSPPQGAPWWYSKLSSSGIPVVQFSAPLGGATTSTGTVYARDELREYERDGITKMAFDPKDGDHWIEAIYRVTGLGVDKRGVCVQQMHDAGDDTIMVRTENNGSGTGLYLNYNGTRVATLNSNFVVGQEFYLKIRVNNGTPEVYYTTNLAAIPSTPTHTAAGYFSGASAGWYSKTGCYNQSNELTDPTLDPDASIIKVEIRELKHWHSKTPMGGAWPTPASYTTTPTGPTAPTVNAGADASILPTGTFARTGTVTLNGNTLGSGAWLSGISMDAVNTIGAWRGRAVEVVSTWSDSTANDQINLWTVAPGGEFYNWTQPLDLAIGAIYTNAGETWSAAASGAYDSRWIQTLQNLNTWRGSRTTYLRFAHEMNGNWFPWSVTSGTTASFITAWRRFRGLQLTYAPNAKLVFSPNVESSSIGWPSMWPGDTYVDVLGVDMYNQFQAQVSSSADWTAKLNTSVTVGGVSEPRGLGAYRQYAQTHGVPISIPEWGGNSESEASGGNNGAFITGVLNYVFANAGNTAGKFLYEVYFNAVTDYGGKFGLYPTSHMATGPDEYRSFFQNAPSSTQWRILSGPSGAGTVLSTTTAVNWTPSAGNTTSTTGGQTLGVGGVATPAPASNVELNTSNRGAMSITASGTSSQPRIYDGGGFSCGRIDINADWIVIQNYRINANSQYGAFINGNNITFQNNDIKGVTPTGDGDLNAITAFGNNINIMYNTAINFVSGSPGGSHTDFIQTWVSSSHPVASSGWKIIGNKATGPSNPSRDNNIASIHQCVMAEGLNRGGNSGGSGDPNNVR
jgi:hypothetical protein